MTQEVSEIITQEFVCTVSSGMVLRLLPHCLHNTRISSAMPLNTFSDSKLQRQMYPFLFFDLKLIYAAVQMYRIIRSIVVTKESTFEQDQPMEKFFIKNWLLPYNIIHVNFGIIWSETIYTV